MSFPRSVLKEELERKMGRDGLGLSLDGRNLGFFTVFSAVSCYRVTAFKYIQILIVVKDGKINNAYHWSSTHRSLPCSLKILCSKSLNS